ncbi:MAG: hypothetical protein HY301_06475 [Verrucomicrobia bacterium]|nr:hypothetical protein [Verrucomicrobiota bacterium]
MRETWLLLESGPGAPADNMAWDEALLLGAESLGAPVLRFYGWTQPAATFGYFQKISEVETWTPLRPLIRRPTGGGLVPHDADWTYNLVIPPAHEWFALRAEESYRRLHEWIRAAFARVQLAAELAPCGDKQLPGRCFAGPEKFDLTWSGNKIAGAAQRRTKHGMLIQGSIQPVPPGVARAAWEAAMRAEAEKMFGVKWEPLSVTDGLREQARELSTQKYSRTEFNRRR